tara:strand:+ start:59601 stop:59888 length:288 start_codon:yes stop_codon:yes gene_type:complete
VPSVAINNLFRCVGITVAKSPHQRLEVFYTVFHEELPAVRDLNIYQTGLSRAQSQMFNPITGDGEKTQVVHFLSGAVFARSFTSDVCSVNSGGGC